jgi:hypothetical protein
VPKAAAKNSRPFFFHAGWSRRSSHKAGITNPRAILECEVNSTAFVNLCAAASALVLGWFSHEQIAALLNPKAVLSGHCAVLQSQSTEQENQHGDEYDRPDNSKSAARSPS